MAQESYAFIGHGKVYFAPVVDGIKGKEFWCGVVSEQTFSHEIEDEKELKEHHTGNSQIWDSVVGSKKTTMNMTVMERRPELLRAALQATEETVAAASVTAETHAVDGIGDTFALKHAKVSNVVITDGSGGALAVNVDYELDAAYGRVEMLTAGHVSPLSVNYSYGTATVYKPMTSNVDYYVVRTEGLNIAGQKDKHVITAYRYKLNPADAYNLINEDFAELAVSGTCLFDDDKNGTYEIVQL